MTEMLRDGVCLPLKYAGDRGYGTLFVGFDKRLQLEVVRVDRPDRAQAFVTLDAVRVALAEYDSSSFPGK